MGATWAVKRLRNGAVTKNRGRQTMEEGGGGGRDLQGAQCSRAQACEGDGRAHAQFSQAAGFREGDTAMSPSKPLAACFFPMGFTCHSTKPPRTTQPVYISAVCIQQSLTSLQAGVKMHHEKEDALLESTTMVLIERDT